MTKINTLTLLSIASRWWTYYGILVLHVSEEQVVKSTKTQTVKLNSTDNLNVY